jgi:hypothetical protein
MYISSRLNNAVVLKIFDITNFFESGHYVNLLVFRSESIQTRLTILSVPVTADTPFSRPMAINILVSIFGRPSMGI